MGARGEVGQGGAFDNNYPPVMWTFDHLVGFLRNCKRQTNALQGGISTENFW